MANADDSIQAAFFNQFALKLEEACGGYAKAQIQLCYAKDKLGMGVRSFYEILSYDKNTDPTSTKPLDILLAHPPGPESDFIEAEVDGKGVNCGEWIQRGDYWVLQIPVLGTWIEMYYNLKKAGDEVVEAADAMKAEFEADIANKQDTIDCLHEELTTLRRGFTSVRELVQSSLDYVDKGEYDNSGKDMLSPVWSAARKLGQLPNAYCLPTSPNPQAIYHEGMLEQGSPESNDHAHVCPNCHQRWPL